MLEEPGELQMLPRELRRRERVIEREKREKGVVVHLSHGDDLRMASPQILDEEPGSLVHVGHGVVDRAPHDVEEVGVGPVAFDRVRDPLRQIAPPGFHSEVHVREPAVLMAIVVPVDPVEIRPVAVDLRRERVGEALEDRLPPVRGVGAEHGHHAKPEVVSSPDETGKARLPAHARGRPIERVVPVIPPVPGGEEHQHPAPGNPRRDPFQNLEHSRVVVEDVAGEMHAVEREDESDPSEPVGSVTAALPAGNLVGGLDVLEVRPRRGLEARGPSDAPTRDPDLALLSPALHFMDRFDPVGDLAGLEVEALGADAVVERGEEEMIVRRKSR